MSRVPKIYMEPLAGYDPWRDAAGFRFDLRVAQNVCRFFETHLSHSKGEHAGKAFKLERWQKQYLAHLFGWKRKDGTRRYRESMLYVARKNGKTTLASGLGIILLVADGEPGAEIYSAAADVQQANICFKEASNMVNADKVLSGILTVYPGYKSMNYDETLSYWRVLSSDANTKHGFNPHGIIIDELHAQKDSQLVEVLETAVAYRRQPLTIYISTADYSGESTCNTMVERGRKIRDGIISDPEFMPILFEVEKDDDWQDETVWKKANPNLGVSVKLDYLRAKYKKALSQPSFENTFKRLHLNMQTEQEHRWLQVAAWDACKGVSGLTVDDLVGKRCFGGLDLSSSQDITAFVLFFPDQRACLPFFWVPRATFEAGKRVEYEVWHRDGLIEVTEGRVINHEDIRRKINELNEIYQIRDIAYDSYHASQLSHKLADEDGINMVAFGQTFRSMSEPSKVLEQMIIEGALEHFGNAVLRWMASNVSIQEHKTTGWIKPVKSSRQSPNKIDGIVSLVMAIGLAIEPEDEEGTSVFDEGSVDYASLWK